jgi:hypothetical protein
MDAYLGEDRDAAGRRAYRGCARAITGADCSRLGPVPPNAYRDRMFPPAEVRRILRRAAELDEASRLPDQAGRGRGHSLEEIERLAGDVGISQSALSRAIAGETAIAPAPPGAFSLAGAPARIAIEETVRGTVSAANHAQLTKAMRGALNELGSAQAVGDSLSWSVSTARGRTVYAIVEPDGDGKVTVRVEENLARLRSSIFGGIGGGLGGGGLGVIAPLIATLSSSFMPVALFSWALFVYLVAREMYVARFRTREKELRKLVTDVAALVEGAGPRVAAGTEERAEPRGARVVDPEREEVAADEEADLARSGSARGMTGRG